MKSADICNADVLLISPESRKYGKYLPVALLSLSSFLESKGVSTKIVDLKEDRGILFNRTGRPEDYFSETVLNVIRQTGPQLVGLTCYTAEYNNVMALAKKIKEAQSVPIVVGGVHPTLMPQDFLFKGSPVDFVIRGDGENPLLELFNSIKQKNVAYKQMTGVGYYDAAADTMVTQGCHVERDLSKFPMPDYRKIDMDYYTKPDIEHVRWMSLAGVSIFTSRGCPYNCEFCAVNFLRSLNKEAGRMRYRSIDQVIDELEFLKREYRIDGFYVLDDCFMVSRERVIEFCDKLKARRLDLIWGAETRVNLIKDDFLIRYMKKAGLVQLDFGVESGSPRMLKEINKQITIDQIRHAFALCRKNGIRTYANILFNMPKETAEDVELTHQLLEEIKPTVVGCGVTVPLLGTALYDKYVFPRLTKEEYELYNGNVYEEIVDKRFKLAHHDINLQMTVRKLNSKYLPALSYNLRLPGAIPLSLPYWRKVFCSYYFMGYLRIYSLFLIRPLLEMMVLFKNALRGLRDSFRHMGSRDT